jgi:hypothetical protein
MRPQNVKAFVCISAYGYNYIIIGCNVFGSKALKQSEIAF